MSKDVVFMAVLSSWQSPHANA